MREKSYYLFLRKLFFWLFSFSFILFTPVIVYYSLGYKFDIKSKKFLKTGAISIKTFPKGISVYLDGKKINETSPCILRDLMPQEYTIDLEKEGFYPYSVTVEVKPSFIEKVDVFLVPQMGDVKKLAADLYIYKFFIIKHLFGKKILAFTDKGIYSIDDDFKTIKKISAQFFNADTANSIESIKIDNDRLIFWSKSNIWMLNIAPQLNDEELSSVSQVYKSEEDIRDVFFGFKARYVLIHDGLKVIALDIDNFKVSFPVYKLSSSKSAVFYDSASETLYIKDKIPSANYFSLFKIEMMPLISERLSNERSKD